MTGPLRSLTLNWKLKLLAFALAVLLWVVVSAEQVTSNWIPVPLQVVVADDEYVLADRAEREVEVRFSGPGRELWDLVIRRPALRLLVSEITDTLEVVALEPRMVQIPNQLSVSALDVNPSQVTLEFSRIGARTVPVAVRVEEMAAGWVLSDTVSAEPSEIQVSGPASRLRGLDRAPTVPVRLEPGDSIIDRVVPLDTTSLGGLELSATQVRITGRVERLVERTMPAVPIDVGAGVDVRPDVTAVRLRGPGSLISRLAPEDFRVVVSIDSIPGNLPADGLPVPVRVEHRFRSVRAEPNPRTVRLFPIVAPDSAAAGAGADPGGGAR